MLRILIKLALSYFGLIGILAMLYWLATLIPVVEYSFFCNYALNIIESLIPAIVACIYSWIVLKILVDISKKRIVMIVNSICLIVISIAINVILYYYTDWLNITIYLVFLKALIIVGIASMFWSILFKS